MNMAILIGQLVVNLSAGIAAHAPLWYFLEPLFTFDEHLGRLSPP
jgi:hypothetical protein